MEINDLKQRQQQNEKKVNQIGLYRLLVLFLMGVCFVGGVVEKQFGLGLISVLFLFVFLYLMKLQSEAKEKLSRISVALDIKDKITKRQYGQFDDEEIQYKGAYYLADLDVVGEDSLYHLLNFSYLEVAKKRLLERLCQPLKDQATILMTQDIFRDLKDRALVYLILEGTLPKKDRKPLTSKDVASIKKMPLYLKLFTTIYPLVVVLGFRFQPFIYYWILLGIVVSGLHFHFWQEAYSLTSRQVEVSAAFTRLIKQIGNEKFNNAWLMDFQKDLLSLEKQKKHLEVIDQLMKFRFNPLLILILNGLCFYDGLLYLVLEKQADTSYLLEIQEKLADYSSLCSMCMWFEIKENTVFPTFSSQLKATRLKHPLMQSNKAVGASFDFNHGCVVITGSNMAGKTTFMRSIGLNLVLFYCGLSVDAASFEAPLLHIYTSMRVADRTQEGISTFYGELLRVKEMVNSAKNNQPAIYLIDEIFKGTNLKDRIIGAKATIEKLTYPNAFLFVSTHDEALCEHEHVSICNVHFEESYVDNKIVFDYQLKDGVAKSTNAKYLMKMIGLLE